MSYSILFTETARKELDMLPDIVLKKVLYAIDALSINPRPAGVKKREFDIKNKSSFAKKFNYK